jgi:hypothetical protein
MLEQSDAIHLKMCFVFFIHNYLVTYKIKKKYVFFYHEITHYYRGITKVTAGGAWQVVCSGKEGA